MLGRTPGREVRVVVNRESASRERVGGVMGVVTEALVQLIAKQVDERRLVVWYDPEQAYGAAAGGGLFPTRLWPGTMAASSDCAKRSITCSTKVSRLDSSCTCR